MSTFMFMLCVKLEFGETQVQSLHDLIDNKVHFDFYFDAIRLKPKC